MDSTYTLTIEAEPKASDMNAITLGLLSFNSLHTGGRIPKYLLITVRDADQAVVGGLGRHYLPRLAAYFMRYG